MPKYMSFFSYTPEAWSRMIAAPENRGLAARKLIEEVGGRMEAFYWMLGEWDGLVIYDVADVAAATAISGRVTSSGLVKAVQTHALIGAEEAREGLETARALGAAYAPPGEHGEWFAEYGLLA